MTVAVRKDKYSVVRTAGSNDETDDDELSSLPPPSAPVKLWWPYATAVIAVLFFLKGSQPIVTKLSMVDGKLLYRVVVMSALVDIAKICTCCVMLPYQLSQTKDASDRKALTAGISVCMLLKYATPSLCFMMGSNISYYALQFIDSTTFLLFGNTKIIFTVVQHSIAFKYTVTKQQWAGAAIVLVGCILSQFHNITGEDSESKYSTSSQLLGIALTVLGVVVHVFASIANEVLFKGQVKQSLWIQNLQLYSWSLLLNTISFIGLCFAQGWQDPFYGFNDWTLYLVVAVAVYGITVSICIKKLDNVVYMYVTLMTPFLTSFLSWWMGTDTVYLTLFAGMCITINGVVVYYKSPKVETLATTTTTAPK